MSASKISRRRILRGTLAGTAIGLGLPCLEIMVNGNGTAYADGTAFPVRYGTFFWGNGNRPDRWVPRVEGPEWWRDPNEALVPVASSSLVRDRVSVFSNFGVVDTSAGGAHHKGRGPVLTGTFDPNQGTYGRPSGPSSDYIVADAWEGQTPIRSVDIAISRAGKSDYTARGQTSWDSTGNTVGAEFSARAVFSRLFGGGIELPSVPAENLQSVRQSMVDVIREDAAALRTRLGVRDKARLDEHLEGIRAVERTLEGFDVSRCSVPGEPTDGFSEDRGHELLEEKCQVMAELIAIGLACDVSRVFTFEFNGMQADTIFWQVGGEQGAHVQTHDDRNFLPEDERLPPQYERVHLSTVFIMQCFTHLLEALARVPEGDGTLLDHAAVYACSPVSDGTRHSYANLPVLVAGTACGRLNAGVHYHAPTERNVVEIPYTCMRAVGLNIDGYGSGSHRTTRTVSEFLA